MPIIDLSGNESITTGITTPLTSLLNESMYLISKLQLGEI